MDKKNDVELIREAEAAIEMIVKNFERETKFHVVTITREFGGPGFRFVVRLSDKFTGGGLS